MVEAVVITKTTLNKTTGITEAGVINNLLTIILEVRTMVEVTGVKIPESVLETTSSTTLPLRLTIGVGETLIRVSGTWLSNTGGDHKTSSAGRASGLRSNPGARLFSFYNYFPFILKCFIGLFLLC